MTQAQDYGTIFADAYQVHSQAIDRLEQGDIRDAAEKHGAPPNGPPTPLSWPEPAKSRAPPPFHPMAWTTLPDMMPRSKLWWAVTTVASANSTVPASTTGSATPKPNAASGKPPTTSGTLRACPPVEPPPELNRATIQCQTPAPTTTSANSA